MGSEVRHIPWVIKDPKSQDTILCWLKVDNFHIIVGDASRLKVTEFEEVQDPEVKNILEEQVKKTAESWQIVRKRDTCQSLN